MEYDIKSDIEIDNYNLDKECLTMASTYYRYAELLADAESLVADKKDNLKVILAERGIAIRENLAQSNVKVTEGIVNAAIDSDLDVRQARKELRDAEATYAKLSAGVDALKIKKSMIDNLIRRANDSSYIDNPAKATREFQAELGSEQMRKTLSPVPNVSRN